MNRRRARRREERIGLEWEEGEKGGAKRCQDLRLVGWTREREGEGAGEGESGLGE